LEERLAAREHPRLTLTIVIAVAAGAAIIGDNVEQPTKSATA
jgi:hypothetical protein